MSSLFDSLSDELFQILKGSGKTLTLFGSDGNKTYDPKKARRVFAVPGNLMVSITEAGSDSEVKLYLSQSTDVEEIAPLIQTLRQVTTRFNVLFNVRKFDRELKPKDFAYQVNMTEAAMFGSTKTSYQKFGPTKLMVRHTSPVREGVIGARGRNILSMFVETAEGERFRFPANHLSGGRAFAQHINQGGKAHDEVGTQIAQLALEAIQLASTARYMHYSRKTLGEEAMAIRPTIKNRVLEIRQAFSGLSRPRGYARVTEAGLPMLQNTLLEGVNDEEARLATLLQIDSNHALAEALKPVAILTLGENMTNTNNLFQGVIALEDAAADALVEALADEYGHDVSALNRSSGLLSFTEEAAFQDAQTYLDTVQESYMINEENAIISATRQWYQDRFDDSDYEQTGGMDKDVAKGEDELIAGVTAIVQGHIDMPDFPERGFNFSKAADATVKARSYLDLFVAQHKLANAATLNFVSGIIDKMAEGKKLAPIETFIANTLVKALDDDLGMNEGTVDESMTDWDASQGDRNDTDFNIQYVLQDLSAEEVLNYSGNEHVVMGDDPREFDALSRKELVANARSLIFSQLEGMGTDDLPMSDAAFQKEAEAFVDEHVVPYVSQKGFELTEDDLTEFAAFDDKPEHHGIAAGSNVATDLGAGRVISIEGDIATIEFLNGSTKTLHVDDMDLVEGFSNVAEEAELDEWFGSFKPENVLSRSEEDDESDINHVLSGSTKKETHPRMWKDHMDEASGSMYHSVFTKLEDGSWAHHFDADDAEDAKDEVRSLKNMGEKSIVIKVPKDQADWTSINPNDFVQQHIAGKKSSQTLPVDEAYGNKAPTFQAWIEYNGEEDVEVDVEYYYDDDRPVIDEIKVKSTGETIEYSTLSQHDQDYLYNGASEDAADRDAHERSYADDAKNDDAMMDRMYGESEELDELSQDKVTNYFSRAAGERGRAERNGDDGKVSRRDRGLNMAFKKMREDDEEVLGGDLGQDLIDDTKVNEAPQDVFAGYDDQMLKTKLRMARENPEYAEYAEQLQTELSRRGVTEEAIFQEELDDLLKNAMFRR